MKTSRVIDSREISNYRRRRRIDKNGVKITTYEISEKRFCELVKNERILKDLKSLLNLLREV